MVPTPCWPACHSVSCCCDLSISVQEGCVFCDSSALCRSCSLLCPARGVCQQHVLLGPWRPAQMDALSAMLGILVQARTLLLRGGRELWLFPSIEKMGLGRGRVDGWFPGILSILHNESFDFFLRNRADTWPTRDSRHEAWSRGEKLWRGMYCSSRQKRAWLWGFWDLIKPVGYTLPRSCGFLSSHVTTSYGSSDTKGCSNRFEQ